jgi:DNA polymerase gamma 1
LSVDLDAKINEIKTDQKQKKKPKLPVLVNGRCFVKIPHKDGDRLNVGNPLAKSFLAKIKEGVLGSIPKENALLALRYHTIISYWENNRDRILAQKAIVVDENAHTGAILPITVVAGTITRRAVEPTWLTASNYSVWSFSFK